MSRTVALWRCQTSFMISSSCGVSVVCLGLMYIRFVVLINSYVKRKIEENEGVKFSACPRGRRSGAELLSLRASGKAEVVKGNRPGGPLREGKLVGALRPRPESAAGLGRPFLRLPMRAAL